MGKLVGKVCRHSFRIGQARLGAALTSNDDGVSQWMFICFGKGFSQRFLANTVHYLSRSFWAIKDGRFGGKKSK